MKKNRILNDFAKTALTVMLLTMTAPLSAQTVFETSSVTPYDINSLATGPQTTDVVMEGYTETDEYHQTLYVSVSNGSDENGDGSPSSPWASIGFAMDQIDDTRLSNRQAILVAAGEYAENTLQMKEFVHLYGGFDPSGWQRDIQNHSTVLDGNGQRRVMKCADNAKVDGFVIQNGAARGNGGAVKCNGTSPVISNNVFRKNKSLTPENWDPEFLHEIASDGGAVAAINGAAPRILNNLFVENETETGRGAGVAAHNRAAPVIAYNVFLYNVAGTDDPMRSSDGGAISSAYYSSSDIFYNVIIGNRAENDNDAGGIFSELWSSVLIAGNLIIDNFADDDGGGVYLSGQVHHYITEPDPVVPKERYLTKMAGNVLVGNTNPGGGHDSGFRFTNDTRVQFDRNITYANFDGVDFRRTMVTGRDNIFLDNVTVRDSDQTARFYNSLILGELRDRSEVDLIESEVMENPPALGSDDFGHIFREDGLTLKINKAQFEPDRHVTVLATGEASGDHPEFINNRIIKLGDRWSVVKSADVQSVTIWGNFEDVRSAEILPTFSIHPQSEFYQKTMRARDE